MATDQSPTCTASELPTLAGTRSRLPSTRSVARQHALGRGTVVAVFEQLVAEGYLESIVGSGTFVSAGQEATQKSNSTKPGPSRDERSRAVASSRGRLIAKHPFPRIFTSRTAPVFRLGQPALDAFPVKLWSRIAARVSLRSSIHGTTRKAPASRSALISEAKSS